MKLLRSLRTALCALVLTTLAAYAGDPTGTWKFGEGREGPKGRSVESTLTLKLDGTQLTGSVDNRAGKADISQATFADDQVTFTVTRQLGRGARQQTLTVHYTGKLEGDTLRGTIETTGRNQKEVSVPWVAQREK